MAIDPQQTGIAADSLGAAPALGPLTATPAFNQASSLQSSQPIPAQPVSLQPVVARPIAARPVNAEPLAIGQPRSAAVPATPHARADQAPADDSEDNEGEDAVDAAARNAPPWLLSTVVHMLILIVLGLSMTQSKNHDAAIVELDVYAESLGDQLIDPGIDVAPQTFEPTTDVQSLSLSNLPEVSEPVAIPPPNLSLPAGGPPSSDLSAPSIGYALSGRQAGRKAVLLGKYGGDKTTEEAVERALAWLKRNQRPDGSWSLVGPYQDVSYSENTVAATAMALLAFQGAGHTHQEGEYAAVVEKGLKYLLSTQDREGLFTNREVPSNHLLYTHGQSTIVVCEAYGMTHDSKLRSAAERAVRFCVQAQSPAGGWRYSPRNDADTSVTGWIVMGLQSAKMAGLEVPRETLENVTKYLDKAARENGSKYVYQAHDQIIRDPTMTAEALLCRQYLGWERNDERLLNGVAYLLENTIETSKPNVYYWYYATQVCHHQEGEAWKKWNAVMRQMVPAAQVKSGAETGSWDPQQDEWGYQTGRLYQTCLNTYMLEVYYRHLPLYTSVFEKKQ